MSIHEDSDPENQEVPLFAVFGTLTMIYTWMLQVGVILGYYFSGGNWPAPFKYWVVGAAVVLSTSYKVIWGRRHLHYRMRIGREPLTAKRAAIIICFLMGWVLFSVWLMMGPPGPEFRPQ
jgi:hypothetical protein